MVMAREASISRDAEWFVGERKTLAFTVYEENGNVYEDITGWTVQWRLYRRKVAQPVMFLPGIVVDPLAGLVDVEVTVGSYTVGAGTYQQALWRTDPGFESVLAHGTVVLRSPEESA